MKATKYLLLLGLVFVFACKHEKEVSVYCTVDRVFSEPVLRDFERETGIRVRALYDTEETKSTGILNRIIAEKNHPQCDLFWSGDPMRNEVLKSQSITRAFRPDNWDKIAPEYKDRDAHWTGFSARARVLIYNKKFISPDSLPQSFEDCALPAYRGKFSMANPLFGTTSFHIAALFDTWGEEKTKAWLNAIKDNGMILASSNGDVKKKVMRGDAYFGLTDTDDAFEAQKENQDTEFIFTGGKKGQTGCLIIPNAVSLIAGSPHPGEAEQLYRYLVSAGTEEKLALSCAQMPLIQGSKKIEGIPSLDSIKPMAVDYSRLIRHMDKIKSMIKKWVED